VVVDVGAMMKHRTRLPRRRLRLHTLSTRLQCARAQAVQCAASRSGVAEHAQSAAAIKRTRCKRTWATAATRTRRLMGCTFWVSCHMLRRVAAPRCDKCAYDAAWGFN
jgi:hypothetical protein